MAVFAAPAAADHPGEGLRVVKPAVGPPVYTHGPDPRPAAGAARGGGRAFGAGTTPRPPLCATTNYVHVLYARALGARNRLRRSSKAIRASIARTNGVLNAESLASGGPTADYRVRCAADGQLAVDGILTQGGGFGQIIAAARASGFTAPDADYLVFYDGFAGNACGTATTYADDRLSPSNAANAGGGYGVAYAGCWTEETPMHEIAHMMGAVQYDAPHSTGTGTHCNEENDVVCYSPDGGDKNQGAVTNCVGAPRFDCNFDDYFDSAPEPGEYLSTHWNIGSPLNAFITFGAGSGLTDAVTGLVQSLLDGGQTRGSGDGVAGADGEWRYYEINASGGAKALTVSLRHATSNALTLYLRSRREPNTLEYACKAKVKRGVASCRVPRPRGGVWIAGVHSGVGGAGAGFRVRADLSR